MARQVTMVMRDKLLDVIRDPRGQVLERVEHPSTWWDAFKLRWMPRWWLKRWPPRGTVVELVATEAMHGKAARYRSFVAITVRRGAPEE